MSTQSEAVAAPPQLTKKPSKVERRNLRALSWGHALEWYDWAIFGLLSVYLGATFFPSDNPVASTLNALAVFAVGFVARPLGGAVFGFVADRFGRRKIMIFAIGAVALGSFIIGVLPGYETIGIAAPIIVVAARLLQGLSAGVEAPLGTAYALELVPGRPGYVAGFFAFFNNLGNLLAPLSIFCISALLGPEALAAYGWRIPFIIGGALGLIVLWLRRTLPETLNTEAIHTIGAVPTKKNSVWRDVRKYWLSVLATIFIVGAIQAYNYTWIAGLPNLANGLYGEDPTAVFAITTGMGIFLTLGAWVLSRVLDRFPMSRWFVIARVAAIPTIFLALLYSQPGIGTLAGVMFGGAVVLLLNMTIFVVVANSLLPQHIRGTGLGLGYGIGVALFGGTASYLLLWLQNQGLMWVFPTYIAVLCAISVVLYILAKRRNGLFVGE
ncbi:MHS family alpha-ketoglutarate permease-like MFS transporter [Leucobacter komagatae]|uniref:MHS family alpha-ketoglutarate permease-like MFS transporter n=1 Tax=Leucobacter komagatae TaxID=55969 RepID=A0A542Y5M0_9MICO|nr:MFS transporter [Leucobacter komagatae]TQL43388.1 MHS family alpha-ketoglutarate permease-like MFS transporter [Leucobacter komagatae]